MSQRLEQLGRAVAAAQDGELSALDGGPEKEQGRERVISAPVAQRSAPRRQHALMWPRQVWALGLGVAVCVGLWVSVRRPVEPALRVWVPGTESVAESDEHGYFAARADAPLELSFSDGSHVRLEPGSVLRVSALDARGARLSLEHGRAMISVRHTSNTHWWFESGPFTTEVVGTRFALGWEPLEQTFRLHMLEGVVRVSGPVLGPQLRAVAGEIVEVSLREQRAQLSKDAPSPQTVPLAPTPTPSAREIPAHPSQSDSPSPHDTSARRKRAAKPASVEPASDEHEPSEPSFERLARQGRYAEAIAAAEALGWETALSSSARGALWLLADAARLARRPELAASAYLRVRARFAGSSEATRSAFALGRLAHDVQRDARAAAEWFTTYLREAPTGTLAQEALGRLLEVQIEAGHTRAAQDTAARYQSQYPQGPHAPLARGQLEAPR
ncbi:MAG: FecR domain-containing protein [Myxococcales bacterium]